MDRELLSERKRRLRRQVRDHFREWESCEITVGSDLAFRRFWAAVQSTDWPQARPGCLWLVYRTAFRDEYHTIHLVETAHQHGIRLGFPRTQQDPPRMSFAEVAFPDQGVSETYANLGREPTANCPEIDPDRVDLVIVPGLAFTEQGHRLGRGGGYYDRYLAGLPDHVPRIALAFDEHHLVDELPWEDHDQKVDAIVTPWRWILVDPPRPGAPHVQVTDPLHFSSPGREGILSRHRLLGPLPGTASDAEPRE